MTANAKNRATQARSANRLCRVRKEIILLMNTAPLPVDDVGDKHEVRITQWSRRALAVPSAVRGVTLNRESDSLEGHGFSRAANALCQGL
jgi:hypothetical protein